VRYCLLFDKKNVIIAALETVLVFLVACCLWYKFLLPTSYFVAVALFTILLVIQMVKNHHIKFLVFQIALLFLLTRNVYYLATNYSIIPFRDGNWDYGVVKIFMKQNSISVIRELNPPATLLTWYSGWPALHTLAMSLSQISGIDAFYIALLLPSIISICSFIFVYLFVEKIRKPLKMDTRITPLALLIYATSPETVFWPMQFVRQNLGILFFTITLFLISLLTINPRNRKYKALIIFFAMSLVVTHHFTSFIMVAYLFLFSALLVIGKYLAETRFGNSLFWSSPNLSTIGIALATLAFLFVWWDNFGSVIWPTIASGIQRFIGVLIGIEGIKYLPAKAYYPNILTPPWVLSLLTLRDLLIYVPALFGLFLVTTKATKAAAEYFVIYSTLAFGILFITDNLFFRVETYRLVSLSLPFIALLSAASYSQLRKRLKPIWNVPIIVAIIGVLLLSSIIGLWAHNYAPLHIYDPSINSTEVGERNTDFIRVNEFLNEKLSTNKFQRIWTDDINPLVSLLNPIDYNKIKTLTPDSIHELDQYGDNLVCAFKDLNLYSYYRGTFSAKSPHESEVFRYMLYQYLGNELNRIYDDGKYEFWVSELQGKTSSKVRGGY